MSGTRIGQWREDLLPRTHIMAERRVANDSRHLSQPITVEYGFCCFSSTAAASPNSLIGSTVGLLHLTSLQKVSHNNYSSNNQCSYDE